MNKIKVIGVSMLILAYLFSTNVFANTNEELKTHKEMKTVLIENVDDYKNNIQNEITIEDVKYKLKDIKEQENKVTLTKEKELQEEQIVNSNDKYFVLNLFENKKLVEDDGYSGILELQIDSLDIKVKDSYIEQYKTQITKRYENVSQNELNNIPKTIEQNGTTYYLTNPGWEVSQTEKVDGQDIPTLYNGIMTYEGVKQRTIITSYIATVNYKGTLEKEETDSITLSISYEEIPQIDENKDYIPVVVTTTAGVIIFSGIVLLKRKNVKVYNFKNDNWNLVKKCYISRSKKMIDITPLTPMTSKYKIVLSQSAFNKLYLDNVTIKYFDQKRIHQIKDKEFEFWA